LISTLDESQIHVFMLEKSIEARNCSFLLSRRGNDKSPAQTWIHHFSRISSLFGRRSLPFLSDRAHIEEAEGIQRRQFTTVAARAANWFHRISRAHPVTRPTAPFVSFFPRLLHHFLLFLLVLMSGRDRKKSRATSRTALRVYRKKGGSVLDNYCAHCVASSAKDGDDRRGRRRERKKEAG